MNEIFIPVIGIPAPQGSKKYIGKGLMIEASKRVKPWRELIKQAALIHYKDDPITTAVRMEVEFVFPRPKSHYGTGSNSEKLKAKAPLDATTHQLGDLDKLCRACCDGLSVTSGGSVLADDSLIIGLNASKRYIRTINATPGAFIFICT